MPFATEGETSRIEEVFIQDTRVTTGEGLTGLVYNSPGLTFYYLRKGAGASVGVTLANATVGTFTSGGLKEIDPTGMPGWYQIGIPNAAFVATFRGVNIHLRGAANMVPLPLRIEPPPAPAIDYATVKAQLVAALNTDTYSDPAQQAAPDTTSYGVMWRYVYKMLKNRKYQDASGFRLYNAAGTVVDHKATLTSDADHADVGKLVSGP